MINNILNEIPVWVLWGCILVSICMSLTVSLLIGWLIEGETYWFIRELKSLIKRKGK